MIKKILFIIPLILIAQESGETIYIENSCNSCHGNYGEGMGSAPRLMGVKEEVLLKRLKDLKRGKTRSPFGGIMVSFAKSLDENETKIVVKYLSNLKKREDRSRYDEDYNSDRDGSF